MKKNKANISLKNLSDYDNIGFFLSVKKGLCELLIRRFNKRIKNRKPATKSSYDDLVSVIICTSNRCEQSVDSVKSIINQSLSPEKYEIILVNNSKTDIPDNYFPDRVKIVSEPSLGLSKARNTGAAAAKGEYLLYIDDDAVADENMLSAIYYSFKEHSKISIIGGQIILELPNPKPDVFLEGRESVWSGYTVPYKIFREIREQYEFPYGACFAVKHSVLDALGGFSKEYGRCGNNYAGGEETALCFKAQKLGFKIGIEPNAYVRHCVAAKRFSKEHIQKTIYEGIMTTYRLCCDGYTPYKWTHSYINERIKILHSEIELLKKQYKALPVFYKECELDAFQDIKNMILRDKHK